MPKLLCLCQQATINGVVGPNVGLPYSGFVQCDPGSGEGNWGAYVISGTAAQLSAINALSGVVGIVAVTESGETRWAELDSVIATAVRTKLNTFGAARGWPAIPAGATYRTVVLAIFRRLNASYDFGLFDVAD